MELMGFQRAMEYLSNVEIRVSTFISDRHGSIKKEMQEKHTDITHYYDLWHVQKCKYSWSIMF